MNQRSPNQFQQGLPNQMPQNQMPVPPNSPMQAIPNSQSPIVGQNHEASQVPNRMMPQMIQQQPIQIPNNQFQANLPMRPQQIPNQMFQYQIIQMQLKQLPQSMQPMLQSIPQIQNQQMYQQNQMFMPIQNQKIVKSPKSRVARVPSLPINPQIFPQTAGQPPIRQMNFPQGQIPIQKQPIVPIQIQMSEPNKFWNASINQSMSMNINMGQNQNQASISQSLSQNIIRPSNQTNSYDQNWEPEIFKKVDSNESHYLTRESYQNMKTLVCQILNSELYQIYNREGSSTVEYSQEFDSSNIHYLISIISQYLKTTFKQENGVNPFMNPFIAQDAKFIDKLLHDIVNYIVLNEIGQNHSVRNVILLKFPDPEIDGQDDDEFRVEGIAAERDVKGKTQYLVQWEGFSDDENTWEDESNLARYYHLINDFKINGPKQRPKRRIADFISGFVSEGSVYYNVLYQNDEVGTVTSFQARGQRMKQKLLNFLEREHVYQEKERVVIPPKPPKFPKQPKLSPTPSTESIEIPVVPENKISEDDRNELKNSEPNDGPVLKKKKKKKIIKKIIKKKIKKKKISKVPNSDVNELENQEKILMEDPIENGDGNEEEDEIS